MQVFAVAMIFLIVSCSGGGFTEGVKLGKKSDSKEKEEPKSGEGLGNEKDGDDTADQPVQITGTYLTCAETESTETSSLVSCRVANKKDGSTVDLKTLASGWTFDYDILTGATGLVTVRVPNQEFYHVIYDFQASTNVELKALLAATKIVLDMVYLPGVGPAGGGPAFAGLIATFIPKAKTESASGSKSGLSDNIVGTQPIPPNQKNPSTASPPPQQPVTTPVATEEPEFDVPAPSSQNTQPVTVAAPIVPKEDSDGVASQPASPTPKPQPVSQPQTAPQPQTASQPQPALNPKDPVAYFTLVKASDGSLTLQAYFDQISGLSDATFNAAKNLSFAGGVPYLDGTAMIMLTTPMSVSVKKGQKICSGDGRIGAGVISIPLTCR